jgi:hypothetical protein
MFKRAYLRSKEIILIIEVYHGKKKPTYNALWFQMFILLEYVG